MPQLRTENPCFEELYDQLLQRNATQSKLYKEIYKVNYELWLKYTAVLSQKEEVKHQLAILEHETAEQLSRHDSARTVVDNILKRIESLQSYHSTVSPTNESSSPPLTNLSRTIYDQRKLISNQIEELHVIKGEQTTLIERTLELDQQLKDEKKKNAVLQTELSAMVTELDRSRLEAVTASAEYKQLVDRVMRERNRAADELNAANEHIEASLHSGKHYCLPFKVFSNV